MQKCTAPFVCDFFLFEESYQKLWLKVFLFYSLFTINNFHTCFHSIRSKTKHSAILARQWQDEYTGKKSSSSLQRLVVIRENSVTRRLYNQLQKLLGKCKVMYRYDRSNVGEINTSIFTLIMYSTSYYNVGTSRSIT